MDEENWEAETKTDNTDNNNNQVSKGGWQPSRPNTLNTSSNNNHEDSTNDAQTNKVNFFKRNMLRKFENN
jgi:hypothetical protein